MRLLLASATLAATPTPVAAASNAVDGGRPLLRTRERISADGVGSATSPRENAAALPGEECDPSAPTPGLASGGEALDVGVLSAPRCGSAQRCLPDDASALGGRCRDVVPSNDAPNASSWFGKNEPATTRRRLQDDSSYCPAACPAPLCHCAAAGGDLYDCAPELDRVCRDGAVFDCFDVSYFEFYEVMYCDLAGCYANPAQGYAECRCEYSQSYCEIYGEECQVAKCCEGARTEDERSFCVTGVSKAPTRTPTQRPTIRPMMVQMLPPTHQLTDMPTNAPTLTPTKEPTRAPTNKPTVSEAEDEPVIIDMPTSPSESGNTTVIPMKAPTLEPTVSTPAPTYAPSFDVREVTIQPTPDPLGNSTDAPTLAPTKEPMSEPTSSPTAMMAAVVTPEDSCGDFVCNSTENPNTCPNDCRVKSYKTGSEAESHAGGQMFTIEAKRDLTIFSFDVQGKKGGNDNCRVYTREGGYEGHEEDGSGWKLVLSRTASMEKDARSNLGALRPEIDIVAGATQAFFIICKNGLLYAEGKKGVASFGGNGSLAINEGVATKGLFEEVAGYAQFSGTVRYYESAGV